MRPEPAAGRRGARGRGARPADRAERGRPGDVHGARQLGARGADQAVHAAAARRREHLGPVRRADGRRPPSTSSCTSTSTAPAGAAVREIVAVPGRVEQGDRRDGRRLRVARRAPRPGGRVPAARRALRADRHGPRRAAARARLMGVVVGLLLGAGVACVWWSFWVRPAGAGTRATGTAGTPGRRTCSCRPVSRAPRPAGSWRRASLVALLVLVVALAFTRTPSIAVCFAAFAAAGPWALVRGRARRASDAVAAAVARGRRPPGLRHPGRARAARGGRADRGARAGRAAAGVRRVRGGLPRDRAVRRLPGRAQGPAGRPGRGPDRRGAAADPRRRRHRPRAGSCGRWPASCARTCARAASWRRGRAGPSTPHASRSPRPGSCSRCCPPAPAAAAAYNTPAGVAVLLGGGVCTVVAYLLMLRIARLPDDPRVLR